MQLPLESVALFALKLVHETDGGSPVLRDDPVMDEYTREVFELLLRREDLPAIQLKIAACVALALDAVGGIDKPLGRELQRLAADVAQAPTLEQLQAPLLALRDYLKDIQ